MVPKLTPKLPAEIKSDLDPPELTPKELVGRFARANGLKTGKEVAKELREHESTFSEFVKGKSGPVVTVRIREKLEEVTG